MIKIFRLLFILFSLPCFAFAQNKGYQIKVKVDGFAGQTAYLGYYYGSKQYIKDTVQKRPDGFFYFEGKEPLEGGMYLIVLPPSNEYFELIVDDRNAFFSVETKLPASDFIRNMKVSNSKDNLLLYQYLQFLASKREKADDLTKQIKESGVGEEKKEVLQKELAGLSQEVEKYQNKLIAENPTTLTAALVKTGMALPKAPEFTGTEKEINLQQYYWTKKYWFSKTDLSDPRLLRTSFLFQKITDYTTKLTVQQPDSIMVAIDFILQKLNPAPESYKFYLIHFLNDYAKSRVVGMDAVYVHLGEKYYCSGKAPWVDKEELEKICLQVKTLKPLLIGKKAPDLAGIDQSGKKIKLSEISSAIKVLYFLKGTEKGAASSLKELQDLAATYKNRGVEILVICNTDGTYSKNSTCSNLIQQNGLKEFSLQTSSGLQSNDLSLYNIQNTPEIYVLNEKMQILSKKIAIKQIPQVIDFFLK